jgi:hypothetical protein
MFLEHINSFKGYGIYALEENVSIIGDSGRIVNRSVFIRAGTKAIRA